LERVNLAVIGAGFWGKNHVRVFSELDGCEVVAVCDVDLERAKSVATAFRVPRYTSDYRELCDDESIDAVTVCTPSTTHARITVDFVAAGKDVLVEKPMASNLEEALRMVDEIRSSGRKVMVGFIERFNPALVRAVQLLREGRIGDPILIYGRRIGPWPERIGDVGVVHDTAIHDIDLSCHIFGALPRSVFAVGGSVIHTKEDHVQSTLDFGGGRSAMIEANWLTPRKKREMFVTGTEGVLSIEFLKKEVTLEKADGIYSPTVEQREPLRAELEHFVGAVSKGDAPSPDHLDGLVSIAIAEAIVQSIRRGRTVFLEELVDLRELGIRTLG
jgi:UDP-N-acetylglucosamine 3-dehydrogenase